MDKEYGQNIKENMEIMHREYKQKINKNKEQVFFSKYLRFNRILKLCIVEYSMKTEMDGVCDKRTNTNVGTGEKMTVKWKEYDSPKNSEILKVSRECFVRFTKLMKQCTQSQWQTEYYKDDGEIRNRAKTRGEGGPTKHVQLLAHLLMKHGPNKQQ